MSESQRMGKEMKRFVEISGYSRSTVMKICREFGVDHRTATEEEMRDASRRWMNKPRKNAESGRKITVNGASMTLREWARALDIRFQTLESRVWLRRSAEAAIQESIDNPGPWKRGHVTKPTDRRVRWVVVQGKKTTLSRVSNVCGISRERVLRLVKKHGEDIGVRLALDLSGKSLDEL